MKATLTFDLTDPEDDASYKLMNQASEMSMVLWEFDQYLRTQLKYTEVPDDLETARDKLWEMLNANYVNLDL